MRAPILPWYRHGVQDYNPPMLDDKQLKGAGSRLAALDHEVVLHLDPGPDEEDKFSQVMCEVLDGLAGVSDGKLRVERRPSAKFPGRASFSLGNIHYLAIPTEVELDPFLELVELHARQPGVEDADLAPGTVEVLMAPTCHHCPAVVRACTQMAAVRRQLLLVIIDVQYYGDLSYGIKSVPAVVVDRTHTSIGPLGEEQLLEVLRDRDTADHYARALESMLKANRVEEAAGMLAAEAGHQALAKLMVEGGFQGRLGLMMLTEEALEKDPHCMDGALPLLLPLLASEDASLRGDLADLLGRIGAPGARRALEDLLKDPNEDVREIAEEALEELREPS